MTANRELSFTEKFLGTVDTMDAEAFANMFTEDGSFTFANNPPAVGRKAVAAQAQFVFDLIDGISHAHRGFWTVGNHEIMEGRCTYHRKDGKVIELPYFSIADLEGGLVKAYRAYVDGAPLLAK